MIEIEQQAEFDYSSLDSDTRTFVQGKAQSIHTRLKRTAEDVIVIGRDLTSVKDKLGRGRFQEWLRAEFEMSQRSAERFIQVAGRFGNTKIANLATTVGVLYELLDSEETVIDMVESSQIPPTLPAIREAKREQQQETVSINRFFEEVAPKFTEWKQERETLIRPPAIDDEVEEEEVMEEDHEDLAVDTNTTEYLPAALHREVVQQEREDHEEPAPANDVAKEKRDAHVMNVMGSSDSPEWYTPTSIIDYTLRLFGEIDLDPCSNSHENPNVLAKTRYTKDDDGLAQTWSGKVYLNPPYGSEIGKWINKLVESYEQGTVEESISLLPARIDTLWFQPLYAYLMCNVRGRIQFANSLYSAPFPCVVVYMGKRTDTFVEVFKSLGPVMRRIG